MDDDDRDESACGRDGQVDAPPPTRALSCLLDQRLASPRDPWDRWGEAGEAER